MSTIAAFVLPGLLLYDRRSHVYSRVLYSLRSVCVYAKVCDEDGLLRGGVVTRVSLVCLSSVNGMSIHGYLRWLEQMKIVGVRRTRVASPVANTRPGLQLTWLHPQTLRQVSIQDARIASLHA